MQRFFVLILFGILLFSCTSGSQSPDSPSKGLATISEKQTDLRHFEPFSKDSKLAVLKEPPTLKLSEDLPRLDGATALYPVYAAFAQAVYPLNDYKYYNGEVKCTTTTGAFNLLINGKVDLIFCTQPSKDQWEAAEKKGVKFQLTPIGKEAFVFFVNQKNPVSELTVKQIQEIYSGKITNWKNLGGRDAVIRPFQRPQGSGSQTIMTKMMAGAQLMNPPMENVVIGMGGIIEEAAAYRNYDTAIGYSFLYFATEMVLEKEIKLLRVDAVEPSRNTIASGKYPFVYDFYAITRENPTENTKKLIDWILSPQGQYLITATGYTAR